MDTHTIVEEFQNSFLHGDFIIQIAKAENLCNSASIAEPEDVTGCIFLKRAFTFSRNFETPFVAIYLGNNCICQTSCHANKYELQEKLTRNIQFIIIF